MKMLNVCLNSNEDAMRDHSTLQNDNYGTIDKNVNILRV